MRERVNVQYTPIINDTGDFYFPPVFVVDTGGKFANDINDDGGGKFATSVNSRKPHNSMNAKKRKKHQSLKGHQLRKGHQHQWVTQEQIEMLTIAGPKQQRKSQWQHDAKTEETPTT
jgi:hypothetical protein